MSSNLVSMVSVTNHPGNEVEDHLYVALIVFVVPWCLDGETVLLLLLAGSSGIDMFVCAVGIAANAVFCMSGVELRFESFLFILLFEFSSSL